MSYDIEISICEICKTSCARLNNAPEIWSHMQFPYDIEKYGVHIVKPMVGTFIPNNEQTVTIFDNGYVKRWYYSGTIFDNLQSMWQEGGVSFQYADTCRRWV